MAFRGRSFTWYTVRSRSQGKARIYVDGVLKATFDNYALATTYHVGRVVRGLTDKVHTVRIVVLGRHHKGATGNQVTVDRFAIG